MRSQNGAPFTVCGFFGPRLDRELRAHLGADRARLRDRDPVGALRCFSSCARLAALHELAERACRPPFSSTTPVIPRGEREAVLAVRRSAGPATPATGQPLEPQRALRGVSPTSTGAFGFTKVAASRSVSPHRSRSSTPRSLSPERSSTSRGRGRGASRRAARARRRAAGGRGGRGRGGGRSRARAASGRGGRRAAGPATAGARRGAAGVAGRPRRRARRGRSCASRRGRRGDGAGTRRRAVLRARDGVRGGRRVGAPRRTIRRPPSVIWSPERSAPRLTFLPLTNVPSALPMSMIEMAPSGATSMTEWMREIFSSSRQRCAEASRPILMISRLNCSLRTSSSRGRP